MPPRFEWVPDAWNKILNADGDTLLLILEEIEDAGAQDLIGMPTVTLTLSQNNRDELCAAVRSALQENELLRARLTVEQEIQAKVCKERDHWFSLVPRADAMQFPFVADWGQ